MSKDMLFYPKNYTDHPFDSFAYDDVLQHLVSKDRVPRLRSWVHENVVVLGLQDIRLENLDEGLNILQSNGYDYIVRNSGGLGVVLDRGVLNISLIIHKDDAPKIEDGYELMFYIIKKSFPEIKIDAYEIVGSYCPGNFDLSVNGQKFAGISQRRIKEAVAVQIYLAVEGSGESRAEVMREFYKRASNLPKLNIVPSVMVALSELIDGLTVKEAERRILDVVKQEIGNIETAHNLTGTDLEEFKKQRQRMVKRNERLN